MTLARLAPIAAVAALALPFGAVAQATGQQVDAAHFTVDTGYILGLGGTPEQRLAQTMTVVSGGELAGMFLPIVCNTGRVTVEVRDVVADAPGTTLIARKRVRGEELNVFSASRFVFVRFAAGTTLASGQRVAVVLSHDGAGSCSVFGSPAASAYAGGRGLFESAANPPGFLPFSDFPGTPDDLPFQLVLD